MKNKFIAIIMTSIMVMSLAACGNKEAETTNTTIANSWVESDKEGVLEATGFELPVLDGAENIVYSYSTEGNLAQVTYRIGQNEWTYRVEATDALEDISGMYYQWIFDEKETLNGRNAQLLVYSDATEDTEFIDDIFVVHVVNWYDESEGVTHSLSVAGKEVDGIDIEVIAEEMMD